MYHAFRSRQRGENEEIRGHTRVSGTYLDYCVDKSCYMTRHVVSFATFYKTTANID